MPFVAGCMSTWDFTTWAFSLFIGRLSSPLAHALHNFYNDVPLLTFFTIFYPTKRGAMSAAAKIELIERRRRRKSFKPFSQFPNHPICQLMQGREEMRIIGKFFQLHWTIQNWQFSSTFEFFPSILHKVEKNEERWKIRKLITVHPARLTLHNFSYKTSEEGKISPSLIFLLAVVDITHKWWHIMAPRNNG